MQEYCEMGIISIAPDETAEEFMDRVASHKTDMHITWDEVASICNRELNQSYGESYYRKRYSKKLLNDIIDSEPEETPSQDLLPAYDGAKVVKKM